MPFEKNHKLAKGRPKGSKNLANTKVRESFGLLLDNNLERMQKDLDELEPKDRLKLLIDISSFIIPKLKSVEVKQESNSNTALFNVQNLFNNMQIKENNEEKSV